MTLTNQKYQYKWEFKKNFMTPFYGWDSAVSRLQPLWGGRLLFTTRLQEIAGTHFFDLGRMKGCVDLGATPSGFEHGTPGLGI